MVVAEAALTAATKAGTTALFKAALDRAEKTLKGAAKAAGIRAIASLKGYSAYLEETNDRVSTFKTFADPTKPVSLLDHFVETKFILQRSKKPVNQDELLARLRRPSRFVISATAGFGKSMVMRYFALALYENPIGRIPIFLELRNLNRVSSPNIVDFIHSSYRQTSEIQSESFRIGLESGIFVLLLDGFDELNHDIRPAIEDQILNLTRKYPLATVIVSGRPDERFKSWKDFSVFKVQPMNQSQIIELINNLDYDNGVRKRFVQKIKTGLFTSHESFMSTPLLAILMLLTFEQNANIPDKMHLFYSEAFRTLFHKHDALKEQYDRSRKSGLAVDEFEKVFAVFCLRTYVLEKLEFTHREISQNIKESLEYESSPVKEADFLFDIEEAVCLFVKEGSSYFFVHRSFQEYFTALFLSTCAEKTRDDFIEKVATRYWDNVLPMLFDMAGDQIAPTWVASNTESYLKSVGHEQGQISPLKARFTHVNFYGTREDLSVHSFEFGEYWKYIAIMMRFYPEVGSPRGMEFAAFVNWARSNLKTTYLQRDRALRDHEGREIAFYSIPLDDMPDDVVKNSLIANLAEHEYKEIRAVYDGLDREQKVKNDFLKSLFAKAV